MSLAYVLTFAVFYLVCSASRPSKPSPKCYDASSQFPKPAEVDCIVAMGALQDDLTFNTPEIFGVYEDATRRVPLDWSFRTCLLTLSVNDASKTDNFSLSSTMPAFAIIEENCLVNAKLGDGFGGWLPVGNGQGFYATVQYDGDYYPPGPTSRFLLSVNTTNNATGSPAS